MYANGPRSKNCNSMLYRVMGCVGVGMLLVLTIAGIQHMSNGKLRNSGSLNTKYLAQLPEDNELDGVEPPSPEELGASTWTLLHSLAVNYDVNPSKEKQQKMQQLFDSLLEFYPCENCRKKLKKVINELPPDYSSNMSLSLWLCRIHNQVNQGLKKPQFPCNMAAIRRRWESY